MYCPFCGANDTKVIDSRLAEDGATVRRRRECSDCNERFTTIETAMLNLPRVIKRDGHRVNFDESKLRDGFLKALEKRPVITEKVEAAMRRIIHKLQTQGEREVSSESIGEAVMSELKKLDKVAYVRFASIYRSFEDVEAFHAEITKLKEASDE